MYIEVEFGYKQTRLFNTNCMTAPLSDAINEKSIKDMQTLLKHKEEQFKKEIAALNKKEAALLKRLEKLEPEEPRDKGPPPPIGGKKPVKKQAGKKKGKEKDSQKQEEKKEQTPEEKKEEKKEEPKEDPKKKKEDEKKKKEEEKKKKEDEKKKGAKKGKEAAEEETKEVEETPEEKLERERGEIRTLLDDVKDKTNKYQDKIKLIHSESAKLKEKLHNPSRIIDLTDGGTDRKFLKTKADLYANEFLTEKAKYTLVEVTHNPDNDEEVVQNVTVNGVCCRTLEEDWAYAEQVKDEEVGKKGAAKGKKK